MEQGNATYINYPLDTGHILIDTGSGYNYHKLKKELFKRGIYNLDYVIISHEDEDHSGNLNNLLKDFRVKIFNSGDIDELEHDINRFVKNLEVIDIKIVSHSHSCTVMIMYKNN